MHTDPENVLFLKSLMDRLDEFKEALGERWPSYQELLVAWQQRLVAVAEGDQVTEEIDELLELLLSSPAAELTRDLLKAAQLSSRKLESALRTESHRPQVPVQAIELNPTVEALGVRLSPQQSKDYVGIPIFFATDRAPATKGYFGRERGALVFGIAEVSIPNLHEIGEVERPRWWRLEFREQPERFVSILQANSIKRQVFLDQLRGMLRDSTQSDVLVFIHGYNVTFTEALRRTAQLAYDLSFPGATVLFSWPSQGRPLSYLVDETNVAWAQAHFQSVLELLLSEVGARNVNVIAHSMGGRALSHALASFQPKLSQAKEQFHHVVLAAPDIDADEFRNLAASFLGLSKRMTLYASSQDWPLRASKRFHGYPRAGESGSNLVIIPDLMDTIDATAVSTGLLGHSYYGDERSVLTDIFTLLRDGTAPPRFGMSRQELANLQYWAFRP